MEEEHSAVRSRRSLPTWLRPSFDETALFMMAVTCILLLVFPTGLRGDLMAILESPFIFIVSWAALGLVISVFNAFTSHKKTNFEKVSMAVFAMVTNVAAGLAIGVGRFVGLLAGGRLLAVINIASAVALVYEITWFEEDCVLDEDARPVDLLAGVVALGIVFALCQSRGWPWPFTFSVCVAYSTLIHGNVIEVVQELRARARTDSA